MGQMEVMIKGGQLGRSGWGSQYEWSRWVNEKGIGGSMEGIKLGQLEKHVGEVRRIGSDVKCIIVCCSC